MADAASQVLTFHGEIKTEFDVFRKKKPGRVFWLEKAKQEQQENQKATRKRFVAEKTKK